MLHGADVIFGGNCDRADLLTLELSSDVSIDSSERVHLGQFLSLNETDLELLEFFLDLCGHQDDLVD